MREQVARRPHIYELDPLRVLTASSVIAVHVVALSVYFSRSTLSFQLQNAVVISLHFTRAVFMFVTAFALVYVYYGRPFSLKRFWSKRGISFLLPYIFWSIVYMPYTFRGITPSEFLPKTAFAILTGEASFQLYYILLSLQFYIFLPVFLFFLKRVARHPWIALSISFVVQVVLFYVDYHYLQQSKLAATSNFWWNVQHYQDRFLFTYQFFFLLGGFTALYFQQVKSFLLRHGRLVVGGFLAILAATWLHFAIQLGIYRLSMDTATSVLQPAIVFYSPAAIFFLLWFACHWAGRKGPDGRPRGYRFWSKLSDASYGVYLIHVFFMNGILHHVFPLMPTSWPVSLRVFLTWSLTAGTTFLVVVALLHVPFVSRLFGRPRLRWQEASRQEKAVPLIESRPQSPESVSANKAG